jgi:FkbH-like protein
MLKNLEWLPSPPVDFGVQLQKLRAKVASGDFRSLDTDVLTLAGAAFDEGGLRKLSRLAADIGAKKGLQLGLMQALKVGLIGDGTLSLLCPAIVGSALRHGLVLSVIEGGYNSAIQEALDADSAIRNSGLDVVVLASDARLLGLEQMAESQSDAHARIDAAFSKIRTIVDGLRPSVSSTIFVQTITPPLDSLFGSFDRLEPATPFSMVAALNDRLVNWASSGAVTLIDVARLAASVGVERWDDPRHWHASKLTFSPDLIPLYADLVARTIAAARGKSRKCLVLDLDNTLWGGVIGDDGVAGIKLGQGSGTGEAYLAVQRMALELRRRGIVLAVCSKNEDETARQAFREHPEMLLRESHIAVFQANWTDKATNLRAIAETLNIGIDALVFLDDNPAERLQVRRELPMVAVPELPEDPALYPRILSAAGYFEAVAFSAEDRARAGYYEANAQRATELAACSNIGAYLASLEMVCTFGAVDDKSRSRVAQLINKSNQFNLTTRRYSEAEVAALALDPCRHIVQVRLVDRFGDNGIIAVLIAAINGARWEIDTWLMSCRVLGRRVEEACLSHLAAAAKRAGAHELVGCYIPSTKNRMVADHYKKLGFTLAESGESGETVWRLDIENYRPPTLEMHIVDDISNANEIAA